MTPKFQPVDYSKMTEQEFLEFLDKESSRLREENYTRPFGRVASGKKIKEHKLLKKSQSKK